MHFHKIFKPYEELIFTNDPATKHRILEEMERQKDEAEDSKSGTVCERD